MPFPAAANDEDYCYLTTTGRVSGTPRTIEIWFTLTANTIYLLSGGGWNAHWVRNLARDPTIRIRIADHTCRGHARIVSERDEDTTARQLLLRKYRPRAERYHRRWGGDVERWSHAPLAVAVELDAGDAAR